MIAKRDRQDVKTALINLDSARSEVRVANLGVQLSKEEWIRRETASMRRGRQY